MQPAPQNQIQHQPATELESDEFEDFRLREEEKVLYKHLECVKQEAQLITHEGEIITRLENAMGDGEQYDMLEYLETAEQIAERKLKMYSELVKHIQDFR